MTAVAVFAVLSSICMAGPYALGVRPKTRGQWLSLAITIAFLAWVLPLMVSLRSR
ncbi:MAG TPA: hypothetical protein VKD69_23345 [Vicinamibacterales bacterium]|nr:hypothetical protein [Vicinamibacterales bacterium]